MNFLAHLYLSGDNPKTLVGNFIGDFVKGRNILDRYDTDVVKGIMLHRAIDEFTDQHEVVTQSKNRLRPRYRHYAPVIVDVFYDHFLANQWDLYHSEPLAEFAQRMYGVIRLYEAILPEKAKYMLPYMINGNWLLNYARLEGIERALNGMASRSPYESKMDEAVNELREYYSEFKNEFNQFFPDLVVHCRNFLHVKA